MNIVLVLLSVAIAHAIFSLSKIIGAIRITRRNKNKIIHKKDVFTMDEVVRILGTYLIFLVGICVEMLIFKNKVSEQLATVIEYALLIYSGIVIVLLCYASFDYGKWIFFPKFSAYPSKIRIKRMILYFIIAVYSVWAGYCKCTGNTNIELVKLVDEIYIMSIFAFERIVSIYYEMRKEESEERRKKDAQY